MGYRSMASWGASGNDQTNDEQRLKSVHAVRNAAVNSLLRVVLGLVDCNKNIISFV